MTGPRRESRDGATKTMTVSVDDSAGTARAIGNDMLSVSIQMASGQQDVTGLDVSAFERILLLADLQMTFQGVFNDAAAMSHAVFKDYRTNAGTELGRTVTLVHSGQTLAEPALLLTGYNLSRAQGGELTWEAPGMLADGSVPAWS